MKIKRFKHEDNSLKQLPLTAHGLIFGMIFASVIGGWGGGGLFSEGLIFGGAYYRNFTVDM